MKVRIVHVAVNDGRLVASDTKGRVWERNERMPLGEWGLVTLPDEPIPKRHRRKRRV